MFNFGLDFSHLLVNGIPTNNQLHQALIRAQSMPFEQKSGFSSAFEPVFQFQQPGANTHEFCRFLETFFNCVLKSRGKVDVPQRSIGASNGILWPPKTLSPPPTTAALPQLRRNSQRHPGGSQTDGSAARWSCSNIPIRAFPYTKQEEINNRNTGANLQTRWEGSTANWPAAESHNPAPTANSLHLPVIGHRLQPTSCCPCATKTVVTATTFAIPSTQGDAAAAPLSANPE